MAVVTKTFPYEILIRFSEGAEHQNSKPGELEGAHFIERVRLVDEDTGEIVGTPRGEEQDRAKDLPKDKVQEYLGESFLAFEAQIKALKQQSKDDATLSQAQLATANEKIERLLAITDAAARFATKANVDIAGILSAAATAVEDKPAEA